MNFKLILRLVLRDWRAGELRLLVSAIIIAVGTVTSTTMFVSRFLEAMELESSSFMAADRSISGGMPIPDSFRGPAAKLGLQISNSLLFVSMVVPTEGPDRTHLVSVKAVDAAYPLRGKLLVSDKPYGEILPTEDIPEPGTVWLDRRLFPALGVEKGDSVRVGYKQLVVTQVLASDPDRSGRFFDFGPRLLMRIEDIPATKMIQPGSNIDYRMLLAGPRDNLRLFHDQIRAELSPNFQWRNIRDAVPRLGRALNRAERFLLLGGSLAVLLAGVAIALTSRRYAKRHYDHVGILKTLGATPGDIQWAYFGVLWVVACIGVVIGVALGTLLHFGLITALKPYLPAELPLPSPRPFVVGAVTGFVCLLTFALPPIIALRRVSPLRVIRRDLSNMATPSVITNSIAILGSFGLLFWYSDGFWLTVWTLTGILLVLLGFAVVGIVLLRGGRVIGMHAGNAWRLALAGLQRAYKENLVQILMFGLAIMLLFILLLVRTSLIEEWKMQLPENTPNHWLLNVGSHEVDRIRRVLDENAVYDGRLYPLIGGRVTKVNDVPTREYVRSLVPPRGWGLESERRLTWMREKPDDNELVRGEWWDPDTAEFLASLEFGYATRWGLDIDDELEITAGGKSIRARVANIRTVERGEIGPFFFIALSPPALDRVPATYMGSFFLPPTRNQVLIDLLRDFPTVTIIDVDSIIQQMQTIISRVTSAAEWILLLIFASGVLVLIASIQASQDRRMKEYALIRTLGGSRKLISGALAIEFAALGIFAGLVGVMGAELTAYLLATKVFEFDYNVHPWVWVSGPLIGSVLITTVGYVGTRKLVNVPPASILRDL